MCSLSRFVNTRNTISTSLHPFPLNPILHVNRQIECRLQNYESVLEDGHQYMWAHRYARPYRDMFLSPSHEQMEKNGAVHGNMFAKMTANLSEKGVRANKRRPCSHGCIVFVCGKPVESSAQRSE